MGESIAIIEANCRACGSTRKHRLQIGLNDIEEGCGGSYDIARCDDCGLVYLSRTPRPDHLQLAYSVDYYTRSAKSQSAIAKHLYKLKHALRYRGLMKLLKHQPRSILEIGCGKAGFLAYLEWRASSGTVLVGTDISFGRTLLPPDSRVQLLEISAEALNSGQQFDLIIMHHVLEHVADPVAALRNIKRHLTAGGILVGEVPNWDSPWRTVFPRHWGGLQIPRHQTFFTADSLENVLHAAGLNADRISYPADPGDLSVSVGNWLVTTLKRKVAFRRSRMFMPLIVAGAPIVALHALLWPRSGGLGFICTARQSS